VATTCSTTWRTGCDHTTSTIMSWWKVSKHGWPHFFYVGIQKPIFWCGSASIPAVSVLRSSLCTYFCMQYFFLIACFLNSSQEATFWIALIVIYLVFERLFIMQFHDGK
jgi:hypothetical protein